MNKLLIASGVLVTTLIANSAFAQDSTQAPLTPPDAPAAAIGTLPPPPPPPISTSTPPVPPRIGTGTVPSRPLPEVNTDSGFRPNRETNKELIERIRAERSATTVPARPSTVPVDIRILPPDGAQLYGSSTLRGQVPRSYLIRASSSSSTPWGFTVRELAASGSRAVFLRSQGTTLTGFGSTSGFIEYRIEQRTPIERFMDRMLTLFRGR